MTKLEFDSHNEASKGKENWRCKIGLHKYVTVSNVLRIEEDVCVVNTCLICDRIEVQRVAHTYRKEFEQKP